MKKRIFSILLAALLVSGMCGITFGATEQPQTKVMIDGKYVNFMDSKPVNVEGYTYVPYSQALESMGAKVGYDDKTGVISATLRDTTIEFKNDSDVIDVQKNGVKSQIKMSVAPIIVGNSTLFPIRSLSDSLGMSISWDADNDTVVIIDFAKLCADIDTRYTILNKLISLKNDPDKTYDVNGDYIINMKVDAGLEGSMSVDINSKIAMLSKDQDLSMILGMNINADLSKMPAGSTDGVEPILDMLKDIEIQVIYNNSSSTLYVNLGKFGNLIAAFVPDIQIDDNSWFKIDLSDYVGTSDAPDEIVKIMNGDTSSVTVGTLLKLVLNQSDLYDSQSYEQIVFAADICDALLSDTAFKVSGTAEKPKYDFEINTTLIKNSVIAALLKHPTMIAASLEQINKTDFEKLIQFSLKCSFTINSMHEYSSTINLKMNIDSKEIADTFGDSPDAFSNLKFELNSESATPGKTTMKFNFSMGTGNGEGVLSLTETGDMTMDTVITDKNVLTMPPPDANIIDLNELFH